MDDITTRAAELGTLAGINAASWVFDGNTSDDNYGMFLRLLDDGDPELGDVYGPSTGWLSGEWADTPTPRTLAEDLGIDQDDTDTVDAVATAYEDAAEAAYWAELERIARLHTEA